LAEPATSTAWLAILLGTYLLAGGFGAILRGHLWAEIIDEFDRSPGLVAVTGVVAFVVGALVVTVHNVWNSPAAILVSAAGWIACAEGLSLLTVPQLWLRFARPMIAAPRIWGAVMIVLGAYLLAAALISGPAVPVS
jgi:uncharacterized protein YjeT (DUF2065 family)